MGQKAEMIALAQESTRSKMPVTHWIFSWREGEQPTRRQVDEVVSIFLENMGLVGHQTIFALHQDTNNYHLHIAVNCMNEVTGKVVLPFNGFDIEASHKIVAMIEHKQGWKSEEGARYTVEGGELIRRKQRAKPRVAPKQRALEFEHATGEKSAQRIAQERGHSIISKATTWKELHEKLAEVGLRFEKKGSGGVVFVASLEGEIAVKASSIDRKFSMGKLCKRLGDFIEGDYPKATKKHPPEPVSATSLSEWEVYQAECRNIEAEQKETSEEAELEALKKRHKEERENATTKLKKHGLSVLNIARHFLAQQQKDELNELRKSSKYKARRRRKRPRFETWLRNRGLHKQADLWRYRKSAKQRHPLQDFLDEAWCKIGTCS